MEYSAKTPLQLHRYYLLLAGIPPSLHIGIIFTHILFAKGGENLQRAHISLTSIRFWRFMPKGEKVLAQSKRTAPPPISKVFKEVFNWYCIFDIFQIGITPFKK
jgi:hypothetical protein